MVSNHIIIVLWCGIAYCLNFFVMTLVKGELENGGVFLEYVVWNFGISSAFGIFFNFGFSYFFFDISLFGVNLLF